MSRKVFLDAFYNTFHTFMDQLVLVFPDDSDVPTYKTGVSLLQRTNPVLLPKEVLAHVSPFEASVRARDEKFFLEYSFNEYKDDALDQIIGKVKGLWSTLSDNNKKCIWDYIILLLDLAYRCSGDKSTA